MIEHIRTLRRTDERNNSNERVGKDVEYLQMINAWHIQMSNVGHTIVPITSKGNPNSMLKNNW